jgi:hypothetical protein
MKPQEAIADARVIANDPNPSPRYSDSLLLGYFNDFLKELAKRKRELFHEIKEITMVAGEFQSVSRGSTNGLIDVIRNDGNEAVNLVMRSDIEMQAPLWRKDVTTQKPINWSRVVLGNDFDFMVYPKATSGSKLLAVVAAVPVDVAADDVGIDLPNISSGYKAAAAMYVAGRAISINTSSVDVQKGIALVNTSFEML